MSQTNNCALKKIVNSTPLWPTSLNKPLASVTSYVFKSQENTQKFVKFMREKLPRVEIKVSRDDKNFYIVNLTNLTKGCKNGVNVGNYYKENGNYYKENENYYNENGYIPCEIAESKCPYGVYISYGGFFCKCAYY